MNKMQYSVEKYQDSSDFRVKVVNFALADYGGMLKWRGRERVLDIGCGPGDVTHQCFFPLLPHDFEELVCGDLSPEMLQVAEKEFLGVEHVSFVQMDIRETPNDAQKESFDRIFSTLCFMYIADQENAFKNVFDLLAPGGDCWIMQVTTSPVIQPLFQLADTTKWREKLKDLREILIFPFWNDSDPVGTAEGFMKSIGFEDIEIYLQDGYVQFESEEKFEAFMDSLPIYSANLTEEDRRDLLQEQIEIAKSLNVFKNDSQETPQEPYKILITYGRKPMN
ncbi:juvenile hormone acid O-methyltransferase-like [Lutzomyia longipalpis]|uniref:juvenile hormone acid O-methyltransferase-like n=1 Tax=Lutzomyia longipalpis TaxID=7200 RepID=UPI0024835245|nr:juvenile hormone acid O-methyltransferase-like [Lutzomyia longipalpis]